MQSCKSELGGVFMYEISEAFHRQYADMYDKFVRIHFKDSSVRTGLFSDEFYDDSSILVSCEVIKITDIDRMELLDKYIPACRTVEGASAALYFYKSLFHSLCCSSGLVVIKP